MEAFSVDDIRNLRKEFLDSLSRDTRKKRYAKKEFRRLAKEKGISADKVDVSIRKLYEFASFDM